MMQNLLVIIVMIFSFSSYLQKGEEWYLYTPDKLNIYMYEFGKGDTVLVLHGGFGAEHSYLVEALKPLEKNITIFCLTKGGLYVPQHLIPCSHLKN